MSARGKRVPLPPAEVAEWMARVPGFESDGSADPTGVAALAALRESLLRPGRDREGAYALLAADGLLTWATEDALEADDPERGFEVLIRRVAATLDAAPGGSPE